MPILCHWVEPIPEFLEAVALLAELRGINGRVEFDDFIERPEQTEKRLIGVSSDKASRCVSSAVSETSRTGCATAGGCALICGTSSIESTSAAAIIVPTRVTKKKGIATEGVRGRRSWMPKPAPVNADCRRATALKIEAAWACC